jgi:uncharacterized membrane protein
MLGRVFRTEEAETSRVEAFSDGVLAIVITLLLLEIKVPQDLESDADLWRAIGGLAPSVGAWATSFLFVLVFWVARHTLPAAQGAVPRRYFERAMRRGLVAPALYAVSLVLAFTAPWAAIAIQVLVPVLFVFPTHRPTASAAAPEA